jgi:hypothetical protein
LNQYHDIAQIKKDQEKKNLKAIELGIKKVFTINEFLSNSIFQTKYLATSTFNIIISIFKEKVPNSIDIPTEQKKQFYILDHSNEMRSKIEEVK